MKIDLAKILPVIMSVVQKVAPNTDPVDVVRWFLRFFQNDDKGTLPAPTPSVDPAAPPIGTKTVPANDTTSLKPRIITSLMLKLTGIIRPNNDAQLYTKEEFDEIRSGSNPANTGARLQLDLTPVDSTGEVFRTGQPGHPQGAEGVVYVVGVSYEDGRGESGEINVEDLAGRSGNPRRIPDGFDIRSWDDDFGLTPVLKIHKGVGRGSVTFGAYLPASKLTGGVRVSATPITVRFDG